MWVLLWRLTYSCRQKSTMGDNSQSSKGSTGLSVQINHSYDVVKWYRSSVLAVFQSTFKWPLHVACFFHRTAPVFQRQCLKSKFSKRSKSLMTQVGSYAVIYIALCWLQIQCGRELYKDMNPGRHSSLRTIFGDLLSQEPNHLGFNNTNLKKFPLLLACR